MCVIIGVVEPITIVKSPESLWCGYLAIHCHITETNLVFIARKECGKRCDDIGCIGLDEPLVTDTDKKLTICWAPMDVHNLVIPCLNLCELNNIYVIKRIGRRRRDINAVEIHLEGVERVEGVGGKGWKEEGVIYFLSHISFNFFTHRKKLTQ